MNRVASVILSFNPEINFFSSTVETLVNSDVDVIVVDNNSSRAIKEKLRSLIQSFSGHVELIENKDNLGVGRGYNIGIKRALEKNKHYILLLDQDSVPHIDMLKYLQKAFTDLQNANIPVAAVGPKVVITDLPDKRHFIGFKKLKFGFLVNTLSEEEYTGADHLITSGMFISEESLRKIGLMNEEFFIDCIDTEWCLRAKSVGYRLFGVKKAVLNHKLGEKTKILFGIYPFHVHFPFRTYFKIRNSILLLRKPYIPFSYKLTELIRILIKVLVYPCVSIQKKKQIIAIILGIYDGCKGITKRNYTVFHDSLL